MEVSFRPDKAPGHVKNFIKLAKDGFYDGTRFHRVLKGFMLQGGDPNTRDNDPSNDGMGGPGYSINAEFNDIKHDKGVLSMARSTDPNSAGSQFFVMHARSPHLDNQYSAFGQVEKGLEVIDTIANIETAMSGGGERSRPVKDVWLKRAVVLGVTK
jgi:peptidyl-prolyl cis-trans isomerase B (cyclophilin B)